MERTKKVLSSIQRPNPHLVNDAINCGVIKNYTQVPNALIRNPEISGKAKAIQSLLLSNKEGWKSYVITITKMMKEGQDAIQTGLQELEEFGYLLRLRYRDKTTKKWVGSFWAYTDIPFQFNITKQLKFLDKLNYEIPKKPHKGFPHLAFPDLDEPHVEDPVLKRLNNKKTNSKEEQLDHFLAYFPKWKDDKFFHESIQSYFLHRLEKSPLTKEAMKRLSKKLLKHPMADAIAALDASVENGWTGVFPDGNNGGGNRRPQLPSGYIDKRNHSYVKEV